MVPMACRFRESREGSEEMMGQAFSALMPCPYCIYSAVLPALFTKTLTDEEATEGKSVSLRCELNKAAANVEWKKGFKSLRSSDKYQMKREGVTAELTIQNLDVTDAGNYSCVCGDQQTMAVLTVHGKPNQTRHSNSPVLSVPLDRALVTTSFLLPDPHSQLTGASVRKAGTHSTRGVALCKLRVEASRVTAAVFIRVHHFTFPI